MMDQYSTAVGNVIYLGSVPEIHIETYARDLGTFVLGDSEEPKDTLGILSHVKFGMLGGMQKIQAKYPDFDLATENNPAKYRDLLTEDEWVLLQANISDRDLLLEAKAMFEGKIAWSDEKLGSLLNETAISMTTDDVAGFANTQGGFMEGMHQKETSVGSVDAMLAGAKRSSAIEMVEIDTVPDFSGVMNAMKSKGLI
jgi:hypothetical protein